MFNPFKIFFSILTFPFRLIFGSRQDRAFDNIPTLQMQAYRMYKPTDPNAPLLEMQGRYSGWRAFILSQMGIQAKPLLRVTGKELRVSVSTLSETTHTVVPLSNITTSVCAIQKPVRALRISIALFILTTLVFAGLVALPSTSSSRQNSTLTDALPYLGITLLISVALFAYYRVNNRLVVGFSTGDIDSCYGMAFTDFSKLRYDKLAHTIGVINHAIVRAHLIEAKNEE